MELILGKVSNGFQDVNWRRSNALFQTENLFQMPIQNLIKHIRCTAQ